MSLLRLCLEGAALAGLVAAACFLVPRMKASHKAMLWWLVAAKLLVGLVPIPAIEVAALPSVSTVPVVAVATALAPRMENAFSMAPALVDSVSPGLSGVDMPMAPLNLSTGMSVP